MSGRWWRAYDEAVDNPKLQRLPPVLFKAWFNLCCITSANGGTLPPVADIAFKLRTSEAKVRTILSDLTSAGLIDADETGSRPHNWRARQFISDRDPTATERQRRKRDKDKGVTRDTSVTSRPPETEQNRADTDARAKPLDDLGKARVAIVKAFKEANSPNLPDTSRVELWKAQGYDLAICVATVRDGVRRKPSVTTLAYFDGAIAEAHAKRNPAPIEPKETDWSAWCEGYANGSPWPMSLGPEPGYAGCRAPPEILEQHGIDSKTGIPKALRRVSEAPERVEG